MDAIACLLLFDLVLHERGLVYQMWGVLQILCVWCDADVCVCTTRANFLCVWCDVSMYAGLEKGEG